jgi:hypothetical protein
LCSKVTDSFYALMTRTSTTAVMAHGGDLCLS